MKEKKYLITAACVYLAYFAHGMQAIVISQHRDQFMAQWGTDLAGIMSVIAFTGLAKFLSVWICGELSDKIGRRPMIVLGAVFYVVFFVGLLTADNIIVANICAFLAGAATSLFDGACYPALQESFPKAPGSALVLVKGFISVSGMIYPILVGYLASGTMWKMGIWIPAIVSILVLVLSFIAPFSYDAELKANKGKNVEKKNEAADAEIAAATARFVTKPKFKIEGICCLVYGFVCMMTFYLISQCITIFGKDVIGMTDMASRALMTYYTVGSLIAVLLASVIMAKGIRTISVLLVFTSGSLLSLLLMCFVRVPVVTMITSFTIGFFAAGGALQAGIAIMGEFFPGKKGRNLGIYYTFMGLASYVGPAFASKLLSLSTKGLEQGTAEYVAAEVAGKVNIMYFDLLIAALGVVLMVIIAVRYKKVFGVSAFSRKGADEK